MRTHQSNMRLSWLTGFGVSTLMMLALFMLTDMQFAVNDDKAILRAFSGYQPGGAATFQMFIHPILAYPLHWLGNAAPGVAWYSGMQLLFLWFSNMVITKSIVQCFARAGKPVWLGVAMAGACLVVFGMIYSIEITFTATAAFLGAAAVAQILSLDWKEADDAAVMRCAGLSLLLVTLAYGLRQLAAIPVLACCGLAFGMQALRFLGMGGGHRRSLKPLWLVAGAVALVMLLLMGLWEWDINHKGQREYVRWQQARFRVMDYVDLNQVDAAVYEQIGWKPSEVDMVLQWFLADENITTEAFDIIYESQAQPPSFQNARTRLIRFVQTDPLGFRAFQVLFCMGAACLIALVARRKQRLLPFLGVVTMGLLCIAMLAYLALSGRVLMRGLLVFAFPAAAFLCCLFPFCLPERGERSPIRRCLPALAATLLLASVVRYAVPAVSYIREMEYNKDIPAQMDTLALSQPDKLFFFQIDCGNDPRLFPDISGGVPVNLVSLGTWERGGEAYARQLAAFGLDSEALHASDFLNDDVRIISTSPDVSESFLRYLNDYAGTPVMWERERTVGDLYIYRFSAENP